METTALDKVLERYRDNFGVRSDLANEIHKEACAELAALKAERDELKQWQTDARKEFEAVQVFVESLPREDRVDYFVGGKSIVQSLIKYAAALKGKTK